MDLKDCTLCPRQCHVDRTAGKTGYCGQANEIVAARAALHMWEEPCISGTNGSGTVFFAGCNMRCVFCQNYDIAHGNAPCKIISVSRLAEVFLELQAKGAHNINLVTPTHYVPQIIDALTIAKNNGLILPVVYNTSSYEKVETLKNLEGLVDIYLPDLKYYSSSISARYSNAPDYFTIASAAIAEMYRQVGSPVFEPPFDSETSLMKKGVIVRHLLLPDCTEDSRSIIRYLFETYGNNIYMSLMNQYTPLPQVAGIPSLNRKITDKEYDAFLDYAISIGIENAYIQEGETASESFIPAFDCEGI
ncbi:MAG: radical SAM protein [Lachnospiraceae bacterium]|nr:radical SAM protein [Lachnospiraceae bacterium]MDD6811207.1 radical SAM protein [Lachnospiraceae bacterium]